MTLIFTFTHFAKLSNPLAWIRDSVLICIFIMKWFPSYRSSGLSFEQKGSCKTWSSDLGNDKNTQDGGQCCFEECQSWSGSWKTGCTWVVASVSKLNLSHQLNKTACFSGRGWCGACWHRGGRGRRRPQSYPLPDLLGKDEKLINAMFTGAVCRHQVILIQVSKCSHKVWPWLCFYSRKNLSP